MKNSGWDESSAVRIFFYEIRRRRTAAHLEYGIVLLFTLLPTRARALFRATSLFSLVFPLAQYARNVLCSIAKGKSNLLKLSY